MQKAAEDIGLQEGPPITDVASSGLEGGGSANADVAGSAADSSSPPPPASPPAMRPEPDCEGPSELGYVTRGGRAIARIVRGNPRGRFAVRCYVHTNCSFLLPLRLDPGDAALKRWLLAVRPADPADTPEQRGQPGVDNVALAKAWREEPAATASGSSEQ